MASSVYDTGYEDELFQYPVGPSLHCCICTNVIKDPVMCHNEHIFCRACITTHLMYSHTCPTCMQPLTVETLRQATRGIRNLLSCSNEGCQLEVNKHDLLYHETAVCAQRRPKCQSCNDIRREMYTVKVSLAAINMKLDRNEKDFNTMEENLKRNEQNVKAVERNLAAKVKLVQQQLNKQQESNRRLEADNIEMKKSLNEIMKQLERMTQQTTHEVHSEEMKKGIAQGGGEDREPKTVIAGGSGLNSVEMFSLATKTWTQLQPMKENRSEASSVVYNNQIVVTGGANKYMEKLSLNAVQVDQSIQWGNVLAKLPRRLSGHRSVVYNGRLIVIGGIDIDKGAHSISITEISLVPPYTSKLLATMSEGRYHPGVAIFGDKIFIVGGVSMESVLKSVIMYDITKNKFQKLAPLPYPVYDMATVKRGDDNVMIMGGDDINNQPLNKVLMYSIKTQKSHELPNMKYKREGCVAAVVRDTVIVMGGKDEKENVLNSVEGFRFDRYSWKELPPMHEARCWATAVVC